MYFLRSPLNYHFDFGRPLDLYCKEEKKSKEYLATVLTTTHFVDSAQQQ